MNEPVAVIRLPGHSVERNLAYEQRCFNDLRDAPRPICLFYVNAPCVVLGRNNPEALWVNTEACRRDNIPIMRRFSGGGTVYHDLDNLNFSFLVPRTQLDQHPQLAGRSGPRAYIDFFRALIVEALSHGGPGYSATGISDVSLNGKKVSGNAQRIAASLVLHHGTIMQRCPLAAIERYLPVPPDRPGRPHREFVTGLVEEGRMHSRVELMDWLAGALAGALQLPLEERGAQDY